MITSAQHKQLSSELVSREGRAEIPRSPGCAQSGPVKRRAYGVLINTFSVEHFNQDLLLNPGLACCGTSGPAAAPSTAGRSSSRLAAASAKAGGCKSPVMKLRRGDKALTSDSPRAADPERCRGDNRVPASLSIVLATNGAGGGWGGVSFSCCFNRIQNQAMGSRLDLHLLSDSCT